jgi:hypothetical protein
MAKKRQGRKCGRPRSTDGMPCKNYAVNGGTVCSVHGGSAPQVKDRARENVIDARLERFLHQHEAEPCGDPLEALQRLAGRALALEQAIGRMVNDLESIRYEDDKGAEQLRSEVAVLERAMDRCGRLLVDIAKLNIEERLAKVTAEQVRLVADAMAATFREMGLPPEQQQEARTRIGRHLRIAA